MESLSILKRTRTHFSPIKTVLVTPFPSEGWRAEGRAVRLPSQGSTTENGLIWTPAAFSLIVFGILLYIELHCIGLRFISQKDLCGVYGSSDMQCAHKQKSNAIKPFSSMTRFHIHSGYYLVILDSFRNLCGD
ncbi:hypothetical protein E2C01_063593 [Portunus trituberculatus]|uniref:Uncharacterized protein n=1 Tax=Portunus trituberculatus TaxID=210409 RepID=A0A5B7HAU9_PORTR|nr:hypothetical protein [Portunus trituberculatus]